MHLRVPPPPLSNGSTKIGVAGRKSVIFGTGFAVFLCRACGNAVPAMCPCGRSRRTPGGLQKDSSQFHAQPGSLPRDPPDCPQVHRAPSRHPQKSVFARVYKGFADFLFAHTRAPIAGGRRRSRRRRAEENPEYFHYQFSCLIILP